MDAIKQALAQLQARFAALTGREQKLVLALIPVFIAVVLFVLIFSFNNSANTIRKRTENKLQQLNAARELAGNFSQAEGKRRAAEQLLSQGNVRLISALEQKAQQNGLQIPSMTPRGETPLGDGRILETRVDLTLADVSVRQTVDFLSSVERGPGVVKVTYLRLEPRPAQENLTATVNVSAYRLGQQAQQ